MRLAFAQIETQLEAELYADGLAICRELLAQGTDSSYAWFLRGRSEYGLKWYREAKTSFEAALKRAPASTEIQDFLDHVSAMLGEGSNTILKNPIPPVALPPELAATSTNRLSAAFAREHGAGYVRRIKAVSFNPGFEYKTTDYVHVLVLDGSGVTAFSTVQIPFDPLSEEIFINEVRVFNAAGVTTSTGAVTDCYVLDAPYDEAVNHKKVVNVPIQGLQPGSELHVTITRRPTVTSPGSLPPAPSFPSSASATRA